MCTHRRCFKHCHETEDLCFGTHEPKFYGEHSTFTQTCAMHSMNLCYERVKSYAASTQLTCMKHYGASLSMDLYATALFLFFFFPTTVKSNENNKQHFLVSYWAIRIVRYVRAAILIFLIFVGVVLCIYILFNGYLFGYSKYKNIRTVQSFVIK